MGIQNLSDGFELKSNTVVSRIYEHLLEAIILGRLQGGERIVETELAATLGVSRQPIREAMRMLEMDGFIELIPYRGAMVVELTPKEVKETLRLKSMVEGFAAWNGAQYFNEQDIAELESILAEMERHMESEDLQGVLESNNRFHKTLVDRVGSERLSKFYESLNHSVRRFQAIGLYKRINWKNSMAEHRRVVEDIKKRDTKASEESGRNHGLHSIERVLSTLKLTERK